jgi:hypothetical protein
MEETDLSQKKDTRIFVWIATVLYLIFFLPCLQFWCMTGMVFDSDAVSRLFGFIFILAWLTVPLSMPISVILIWRRYCKGDYIKANIFCLIPGFAILFALGISTLLTIFHCI